MAEETTAEIEPEQDKVETTKFDFRLPVWLKSKMQNHATKRGLNLTSLTIQLYLNFLEKEEGEQEAPQI